MYSHPEQAIFTKNQETRRGVTVRSVRQDSKQLLDLCAVKCIMRIRGRLSRMCETNFCLRMVIEATRGYNKANRHGQDIGCERCASIQVSVVLLN